MIFCGPKPADAYRTRSSRNVLGPAQILKKEPEEVNKQVNERLIGVRRIGPAASAARWIARIFQGESD
jgi:hypothetical protein